ncbi:MAG TPA: peptidylprolyl isomerase [Verrucomicrobiae bacterium]|nr:peptidylprolyl isomerase [Verrucomicrobiae bacterium]
MLIEKNTMVTLEYTVTDPDGDLVDEGKEPLVYLHGGYGDIYPSIERALEEKDVGDTVLVKLQPAEAFGEYDAELVQIAPLEDLPQPVKVGMQIEAGTAEDGTPVFLRVTDIAGGKAVLDGNHPLAGTALIFSCTVIDIRNAYPQEIAERRRQ